jgi:hypothetical protein
MRAPHHTNSHTSLVGGERWPRPGESAPADRGAEDLAGARIVVMISLSALVAGYESIQALLHPEPLRYVW